MTCKNIRLNFLIVLFLFLLIDYTPVLAQIGRFYSPDENLSSSLINQIYQDKRGFIWIATENGLNKFDGMKFSTYKHMPEDESSLKNDYVRTVFEDSSGNFWIGCIDGLMIYDRASDSFKEIPMYNGDKRVNPHVTRIIETRNKEIWITTSGQGAFSIKNLWIGSENDGLNLYSPKTGKIQTFTAPSRIMSNNISSIAEDRQGNLFVGTLTGGLNRYNQKTKNFEVVPYNKGLPLMVKDLLVSKENLLYIGTEGQGLKYYNSEKNVVEDYESGSALIDFTKGKIYSILQDKDDNLWLGVSQKGIIFTMV